MVLKRLYNERLAQASYLVGCQDCGEAIVIDPNRDFDQYLSAARQEGVRITAVTETHIHADYLSGSRELAKITGATLYLSDEGDADWKYGFANESNVRLVRQGDAIRVGPVRLDVLKTPGHTPEHISFLITDEAASDEPMGIFSGDFIFVGDVGRPDLLETAAGIQGARDSSAKALYDSLQKTSKLPAHLLVWPGHGAGSACGKALGAVPVSSMGYERASNWALQSMSEQVFLSEVLAGQPDPPLYFATMKRLNRDGPPPLKAFMSVPLIANPDTDKSVLADIRSEAAYAKEHLIGSLHLPFNSSRFLTWAGALVPYDQPLILVAESQEQADQAARALTLIGLDEIAGWIASESLAGLAPGRTESTRMMPASKLHEVGDDYTIVDVRHTSEWDEGHIEGAHSAPLNKLAVLATGLTRSKPLAIHCETGSRAVVAASALRRLGFENVVVATGGYGEYEATRPMANSNRS